MNVIDCRFTKPDKLRKDIMPVFTIDAEDNITVYGSLKEMGGTREGTETFSSPEELDALAAKWPGARLVELWNSLPGVEPVERFTSRQVAVRRVWKAIQQLNPTVGAHRRTVATKKGNAGNKASRRTRPATRENSKTARIIALLRKPKGASLKAIMRATGWQAHSVRGFISGHLKKKLGCKIRSFERDGERVYALKG
jgi:Protein of unknown function (DUF3489)